MNPFQTYNARLNTAAASSGVDPRLLKSVMAVTAAGAAAPAVGGLIDLGVGDTTGLNSGEIPLNYLLMAGGGALTGGGTALSEMINEELDRKYKGQSGPAQEVSTRDPKIKEELKRRMKKDGWEAANRWFTDQKAKAEQSGGEGTYTRSGAMKRRMAGALLSSLLGAGVTLPLMKDESY